MIDKRHVEQIEAKKIYSLRNAFSGKSRRLDALYFGKPHPNALVKEKKYYK